MAESSEGAPRPERIGPYDILEVLGSGGMGVVYRARDPRLSRDVALKVIRRTNEADPRWRQRFADEARAAAALNHPNILAVHDVAIDVDSPYIVSELIDGGSLRQELKRGAIRVPRLLDLATQIADALTAAHQAHLIHRDVKPENVMVTRSGRVKIVDFGLAKAIGLADEGAATLTATAPHTIVGTAAYMSPEQARGEPIDFRSDLFAFGAVLYEMVTGRQAFDRTSTIDTLSAILHDEPRPLSELAQNVPADLQRIVQRCLAKAPQERYAATADLLHDLRWMKEHPTSVIAAGISGAAPSQKRRVFTGLAVAVALASGLATGWSLKTPVASSTAEDSIAFVIPPPDGVEWGNTPPEPQPAVSPNGRKLAFVGHSAEGPGVWVRDLGDSKANLVSLALGRRSAGLFWSSDSSRLGYCVGTGLKIHSFDGRPPEMLATDCTGGVATWNENGEILFRREDGIFRISERGGPVSRMTTVDPVRERRHDFPRWLPDGRRFIYTVIGPQEASGIFVANVEGAPSTRVLTDISKCDYVVGPDGASYLVLVRARRLIAQRIDVSTLALIGQPRVLADRMSIGNVAMPSFSASATLLIHRSGGSNRRSAWVWVDRRGQRVGPSHNGRSGIVSAAALSPDESTFVYTTPNADDSDASLWVVDYKRRIEQPLLTPPPSVLLPAFSNRGNRIAFPAIEPGARQLYVMDFPTGRPSEVAVRATLGLVGPVWTRDDSALVGTDAGGRIVALRLDSPQEPVTLVPNGGQPQLSPDGRWLAFTSTVSGIPEVYVQSFPGGGDQKRISAQGGRQPRWRGDGAELFYLTADSTLMALAVRPGAQFEVGQPTPLFKEQFISVGPTAFDQAYLPTRNGERFLLHLPTEGPVPMTAVRNWLTRAAAK